MEDKIYLIYYNENLTWYGFNTPLNLVEQIVSENNELNYIEISEDIHKKLITSTHLIDKPVIHLDLIQEDNIKFIDDEKYVYIYSGEDDEIDLNSWIQSKIVSLKRDCSSAIEEGLWITINGQLKHFTWKIEDQINLKNLIAQSENKENVYYKASGGSYELFSFNEIKNIYNQLEDNKNYNLIYTNVFSDWIKENYTIDMYKNKDVISYGYSNDEIINKIKEILYGN